MPATTPGSCTLSGLCNAPADPCWTPSPYPPPPEYLFSYPNYAMCPQAIRFSIKVKFVMKEVLTSLSEIPLPCSIGNEVATRGWVSGVKKGAAFYSGGSSKVLVEGSPCAYHTLATGQNANMRAMNTTGTQTLASQTKVLVAM